VTEIEGALVWSIKGDILAGLKGEEKRRVLWRALECRVCIDGGKWGDGKLYKV